MFKLLACDIDHTILPPGGAISDQDIAAFHRLHQAGVVVVLASGRATASTRRILGSIFRDDLPDYLISFNGARLDSLVEDRTLLSSNLPAHIVREIRDWCVANGAVLQGYGGNNILVEAENEYIGSYAAVAGMGYQVVPDISDAATRLGGCPKLVCHDAKERLPGHIRALESLSGGRWTVVTSIPYFVEILSPGTNKGTALRALAAHLEISMDQVIAIGDNLNDMEMIHDAGTGIAVSNAVPQLKEIADWTTTRPATDSALSEVVDRFF